MKQKKKEEEEEGEYLPKKSSLSFNY